MKTKVQYEAPVIVTVAFMAEQILAASTGVKGSFIDGLEEENFGTF